MVYLGPSRACQTCKRRRKKCDEARPSCMRCLNAKRTCGGYEDGSNLVFRRYDTKDGPSLLPFQSIGRKCSLPVRALMPGSAIFPEDSLPKEVSDEQVEEFALRAFIWDYCILSTNQAVSRGFLHGLESMLHRRGLTSELAKACKAVAFATHGKVLSRPHLLRRGEALYHGLLGYLARSLQDPVTPVSAKDVESFVIAALLGLYEMIVADETDPGYHSTHARGMAAMLQIENSPQHLLRAVRSSRPLILSGVARPDGIFSIPCLRSVDQDFDSLLLLFSEIWQRSEAQLEAAPMSTDDLCLLRDQAISLSQAFQCWQDAQAHGLRPTAAGYVSRESPASHPAAGYWPGRVDIYFDLYVACVWNTYRIARLLIIVLTLKLSEALGDSESHTHQQQQDDIDALRFVEDIIASIPYHLTEDVHFFLGALEDATEILNPGKPVGGLLLMHHLHIASKLAIVPLQMQHYMIECLEWIGTNMGIGQADLLSKASEVHKQSLVSGCMIVWTSMLV